MRETHGGVVVRATRHGALVLETENARRMMRRITGLRPVRDGQSGATAAPVR
ncbi:MAG: hypothetical protein ACXVRH_13025 [Thermoleophilaceae bacterium]